jgi:tetratricopeptide (TPR) repeat protein
MKEKQEEEEITDIIIEDDIKIVSPDLEEKNKNNIEQIKTILENIKKDYIEKNYQKVEDNYKLIFEEKKIENIDNINKEINMIEILNNYALVLYYQMKYEPSVKILFKIIVNYDNKNKDAYLLLLKILCDINEYQKASLLLEKVNKIMNNTEEFEQISKNLESNIKIKNNNIKREFYCNAQKEIFQLKKKLHFFYWCFYSVIVLILGHYLSKKFLE